MISEGLNLGRGVLGKAKQGVNWAKGTGNQFRQGVTAVAKKKPVNENLKFRQFGMGKQGATVQHQTGRLSKTPMEATKLAASKKSSRKLLTAGLGAAGVGGVAYGAGKVQGEHETSQRLKNRPYWMDGGQ